MKSFKLLFMLAGFSSIVVASDVSNIMDDPFFSPMGVNVVDVIASENYMTQLYSQFSELSSSAVKNTYELGSLVIKSGSDLGNTVLGPSVINNTTELSSAAMKNAYEFGTQVSTKIFDFYTSAIKSGSELGASVVKNTTELSSATISTKSSEMTTASVKFVEENQTAVIISATVATALAITALVRYNIYGYVFYSSKKANDKK